MTPVLTQEATVSLRFDTLADRFKNTLSPLDYRLVALLDALGPVHNRLLLDLGCGKGRFASALRQQGARVIGLDRSLGMLAAAPNLPRVRASALRLPFANHTFDALYAVEVLQHLPFHLHQSCIREAARVLKPGARLVLIDRNLLALDDRRPWLPSVLLKRLDEHRGRWMYLPSDPVRERWRSPGNLLRTMSLDLEHTQTRLLLRPEERGRWLFERFPSARRMTLCTGLKPRRPSCPA